MSATDWTTYYARPAATASITRRVTATKLLELFRLYDGDLGAATMVELGGGNSCFFETIRADIRPRRFWIVDSNRAGLARFGRRFPDAGTVRLFERDVLADLDLPERADIVFSAGLIEHFSPADTERAIASHFAAVRPGGLVVMTFPTPTWLYRATRRVIELAGRWIFHDERPLPIEEVLSVVRRFGQPLHASINWPILLTQAMVAVRAGSATPREVDGAAS